MHKIWIVEISLKNRYIVPSGLRGKSVEQILEEIFRDIHCQDLGGLNEMEEHWECN